MSLYYMIFNKSIYLSMIIKAGHRSTSGMFPVLRLLDGIQHGNCLYTVDYSQQVKMEPSAVGTSTMVQLLMYLKKVKSLNVISSPTYLAMLCVHVLV